MILNNKINVNEKMINKKYILRKIKAGLTVTGMIFTLSACGTKKGFDYDQISRNSSFEKQYEEYLGVDINMNDDIETILANYDIAYDAYMRSKNHSNTTKEDLIERRKKVVDAARKLCDVGEVVVRANVSKALSGNDFYISRESNSADGAITKINVDNNKHEVPTPLLRIIEEIEAINDYKGDGSSDAWDKGINDFLDDSNSLYNYILKAYKYDFDINEKGNITYHDITKTK